MPDIVEEIRSACAWVAGRARHVEIRAAAIEPYAASLPLAGDRAMPTPPGDGATPAHPGNGAALADPGAEVHLTAAGPDVLTAFWLTLDAINFGSGWFPTLRKRPGLSGYHTVAAGLRDRFASAGPWSAEELAGMSAAEIAAVLGQDPQHELMGLFAASLRDLGTRLGDDFGGSARAAVQSAGASAVALAGELARWQCFADVSRYAGRAVPFLKRAQIAAADLARSGAIAFSDLDRLTMFADNLVPHVLRLDGVLRFSAALVARIEAGELIEHGSEEEVEIRACALHAVELIAAARPESCPAAIDELLWLRGAGARYKASPRHRSRCTAY